MSKKIQKHAAPQENNVLDDDMALDVSPEQQDKQTISISSEETKSIDHDELVQVETRKIDDVDTHHEDAVFDAKSSNQSDESNQFNQDIEKDRVHDTPTSKTDNQSPEDNMNQSNYTTSQSTPPVVVKQSSGKVLAVVALLFSAVALGAAGLLFVEGQNVLKVQELQFNQKIQEAGLGESRNATVLTNTVAQMQSFEEQLRHLTSAEGEFQQNYQQQMQKMTAAYQDLLKSRSDWLVDEAEAALNLAMQQLAISGNVPAARNILQDLDNRLAHFDQSQLLPIKQAVASDLDTLKNTPYTDVTGTALRLNRLESSVASLSMALDTVLQHGAVSGSTPVESQASWWEKTWQSIWHSLQGMVEVRKIQSDDNLLLSPQQIYFIRENIKLRLASARLALLQRNGEVYTADLNAIELAVKQYFDTQSDNTRLWLDELSQLKTINVHVANDTRVLSNSLAAIKAYQEHMKTIPALTVPDSSSVAVSKEQPNTEIHATAADVQVAKAETKHNANPYSQDSSASLPTAEQENTQGTEPVQVEGVKP